MHELLEFIPICIYSNMRPNVAFHKKRAGDLYAVSLLPWFLVLLVFSGSWDPFKAHIGNDMSQPLLMRCVG